MKQQEAMTEAMYYVLLALDEPAHGYQLMQSIARISQGRVTMGPGTMYGLLGRLTQEKYIEIVREEGRRKIYAITDEGRRALMAEYLRLRSMVGDYSQRKADDPLPEGASHAPV